MYNGLLKLMLPEEVKLVAFADDVAVIITAKHLEEINKIFEETFERIQHWMNTVGLKLAEQKIEAVLVTNRKTVELITLTASDHTITLQPFIRYLGVMIDAKLNFKAHIEHVSRKAAVVGIALSRLMPNARGPKQKRKALLASVTISVLTYGIAIWANATKIEKYRKKAATVHRLSTLVPWYGF